MRCIYIYGAGSFGTALALSLHGAGKEVRLIARSPEAAKNLQQTRFSRYLPDHPLPPSLPIEVAPDPAILHRNTSMIVVATPAQSLSDVLVTIRSWGSDTLPLVLCAKGLHQETGAFLSDFAKTKICNPLALLSGPSFAREMAQGHPTAVMLAANSLELALALAQDLSHPTFRCYGTKDMVGISLAGALKNVIAIGAGLVQGLGYGVNTQSAFLCRGLAETLRLGSVLGAEISTFVGLAGMGDLIATGTSSLSRNFQFGYHWGKTRCLEKAQSELGHRVIEGIATTEAVYHLSQKHKVPMPLSGALYRLLRAEVPLERGESLFFHQFCQE